MVKRAIFLFIIFASEAVHSQSTSLNPWHIIAASGIQYNFGPSNDEAMLEGTTDTLVNTRNYTYRPGYANSVPVGIEIGYSGITNLILGTSVWYNKIKTGVVEEFYQSENDWMKLDVIAFRLSVLLAMGSKTSKKPNCLLLGLSAKGTIPVNVQYNDETNTLFGIEKFNPDVQFNLTIESGFHYYIYRNLLFLTAGFSIDFPSSIFKGLGSIGSVEMSRNSDYTLQNNSLKMYSFNGNLGIGYRIGQKNKAINSN